MTLAEAHDTLRTVNTARPENEWDKALIEALQRALSELFLLNPHDDVDGRIGPRTRAAWKLFLETAAIPARPSIDGASAQRLIDVSRNRVAVIGTPTVALPAEFEFRRGESDANRARSAAAIIRAAHAEGMSKPQIAYVLATAEHESAAFSTLEEFDNGEKYENRKDLGNNQPGDGPRFKGRGYVQLTGRNNYSAYAARSGVKLLAFPVIPMNWAALSVFILVDGMKRGAYTGKRLDQFVNAQKQDFRQARKVVNGLDQADRIAQHAHDWLARLD